MTGLPGKDCQDLAARTGLPGADCPDGEARTGLPGKSYQERAIAGH